MTMTEVETVRSADRSRFLADVVVTALEGGIGYWSEASEYRWWFPDLDGGTCPHSDGHANAFAVIYDIEDDRPEPFRVDLDAIERALAVFRAGPVKGLAEKYRLTIVAQDRSNGDPDPERGVDDIDADLADAIVQVACFGEVIYG